VGPSPLTSWTFDPAAFLLIAASGFLYYRRAATLASRGAPVELWRRLVFGLGLILAFLAVASPIHALGEQQFFFVHMIQHILLGDLAPLCFVAGLTGPLLRPVLALPAVMRLRFLTLPYVAFPIWAANLLLWHLPGAYQAALHHTGIHATQHLLFFACGALMWAPVVEVLPGPAWFGTGMKLGYIASVRVVETILGNIFVPSTAGASLRTPTRESRAV
jgi:cytochrome c oxidase assembly factor CtaG